MKRSKTDNRFTYINKALLLALVLGFSFLGCRTVRPAAEPTPETTASGLEYYVTRKGDRTFAQEGDLVKVHYIGKLEDGTVFENSYEGDEPVSFRLGNGQIIPGLEEGISKLSQGSRATLIIPPSLAYGEKTVGPIPANSTLIFEIELMEISKPAVPSEINTYARQTLSSGLEYVVTEKGNGRPLEPGMRVTVHYTGFLEDETIFDSSYDRGKPIDFILGKGMVISGWEEGLMQLNTGDKARLYIPYHLAYGEGGRGPIPAKANLVFDVEVVNSAVIEPPKPFEVFGRDTVSLDSGLQYIIVQEGNGVKPQPGQVLQVHYSGYLTDGTMFDSSVQRGEIFQFVLGQGQVIRGWDEAFGSLSKNSKARLIIPPHMAYGDRDLGIIPPGSTLVFDVELIDF